MQSAARWLWREIGIAAELSGAAAVAALLSGRYQMKAGEQVCAVVCGAGTDGFSELLAKCKAFVNRTGSS